MVEKLRGNKVGLVLGFYFAILHALWAIVVAVGYGGEKLTLIFSLHFIDMAYGVLPFAWGTALLLIVIAFVCGYLMGWLFVLLWNCKCWRK